MAMTVVMVGWDYQGTEPPAVIAVSLRAVPQRTEWQRIGNQIDAAMIFARADFVGVHRKP